MKKSFVTLSTVIIILLIVFSSNPQVVFADGETPTAEETSTVEETPPPEETEPVSATENSDSVDPTSEVEATPEGGDHVEVTEPVGTPEAVEVTPEPSETTAATVESADQDNLATEQSELAEEANTPSVSEVLEQAPEGTQLVILDNEGNAEPLASQEAADIVVSGDPMWCPSGVLPGGTGCSASYSTFDELLTVLGTFSGDGTIYVADSYDSSLESDDISIDGTVFTNLGALTIQGGWDGVTGGANIVGTSTFNGVSLEVINWGGQVTINDLIFASTNNGLGIETSGSVSLNNVNVNNSLYSDGISIEANGDVILSDVSSSSNAYNGATIVSDGNVSVGNSTFENNSGVGAAIYSGGAANIQNSAFSSNGNGEGLYVEALGTISLNSVTASNNGFSGAVLINNDDVIISNSTFNGNIGSSFNPGLEIDSTGIVTLSSVTASNNPAEGIAIYNSSKVYLSNVTSTNNGWDGAYVAGDCIDVYIHNGIYSGNGFGPLPGFGVYMETGKVHQSGSPLFSNNYAGNLFVDPGFCYFTNGSGGGFYFDDNFNPIIQLTSSAAQYLSCFYDTITFVTQINNRVTFEGVCDLDAIVKDLPQEDPSVTQIPDGMNFVNGISIELLYERQLIDKLASYENIIISFIIPNDIENEEFTVFYFGNNQVVKINNLEKEDGRILVSVKFPGIFILTKK